ncbi:membrane metalloprotease [Wocania ichthyoenteri]|uniref:membrane metalloprotease n=1 Tax=Wocania ichthyoenteri TaxID=1230531 RepID=UPI00053E9E92|nr:membrane metalloprotease [Wocania ichthyoenteri]
MKHKFLITLLLLAFINSCSKEDITNTDLDNGTDNVNITANQKATGSSSNDLLSDNIFKSMVIEVVYVEGFEPTQNTINNFKSFLEARTFKPNGITVEKRAFTPTGKTKYTIQDIITIEDANRTKYNTNNQIAVWAFFADGESDKNTNNSAVLGTAYRNTSFVIFEETIKDLSNSTFEPDRSVLETTVITHEFGHILGLTNLGSDMVNDHEDSEHAKHCNVESCLMYWSAETGDGLSNLIGNSNAPQLDSQCIADLQANGGK